MSVDCSEQIQDSVDDFKGWWSEHWMCTLPQDHDGPHWGTYGSCDEPDFDLNTWISWDSNDGVILAWKHGVDSYSIDGHPLMHNQPAFVVTGLF